MNIERWIASRLSVRRGVAASTSTGAVIAVAGVAVTVVVMLLTLAIVSGFKLQIEQKVMGFDAAVSVLPAYNPDNGTSENLMPVDSSLLAIISAAVPQARVVPEIRSYAILKTDSDFMAVRFVGRSAGHDMTFERDNMIEGVFPEYSDTAARNSIVISQPMSRRLGIEQGDRVLAYFFSEGQPKMRRLTVDGIYRSYFGEYDDMISYASPDLLSDVYSPDAPVCSSISLEGIGRECIEDVSYELQRVLVDDYQTGRLSELHPVTNVHRTGAVFFNWLDLLDTNVVVIFILMAFVAGFTLISSLFILILDRVSTIGILMALGMESRGINRIFVLIALRLTGLGMLIGNIVGLGLIYAQSLWHFIPLNPEMYYLPYVPVHLALWPYVGLNVCVALGAWLILIIPARMASRTSPTEAMRFE